MEKVKVLHIITRLILGGAQENTLYTVEGLMKDPAYDVTLASGPTTGPEGSLVSKAKESGVNLVTINGLTRNINPFRDISAFLSLYKLIRMNDFDIVHTHSSKAGIIGRLAAKLAGRSVIIHTIHGLPFHPYQSRFLNFLYIRLERLAGKYTDKIITVCENMAQKAQAADVKPVYGYVTVYSGMDLGKFIDEKTSSRQAKRNIGLPVDAKVVGKVARLFPLKGYEYFISASKYISECVQNVYFLIVGDGILRGQLEEMVRQMGLKDRFIFAGLVPHDDVPRFIAAMDVVVHTSLREGLARVIPQAMAMSKPVVSFDIDGARELVHKGYTGYLVRPKDTKGLSDRVIDLLNNAEKAEKMGINGKKLVDPAFRIETMIDKIKGIYDNLITKKIKFEARSTKYETISNDQSTND
ncbi:MAG: glycosyltransferase family 4 protein [bacterium]|nr:glycosyltransferase family 4 protein [bacterium]